MFSGLVTGTFTPWAALQCPLGAVSQNTSTCNLWVNLKCVFIMMLKTFGDSYSRNRLSINADLSLKRHRNKENPAVWGFPVTWVKIAWWSASLFLLAPPGGCLWPYRPKFSGSPNWARSQQFLHSFLSPLGSRALLIALHPDRVTFQSFSWQLFNKISAHPSVHIHRA